VLAAAFAAAWLLGRAPASWRHFLWAAALAGLLALPVAVRTTPKWGVMTAPVTMWQANTEAPRSIVTGRGEIRPAWISALLLLWMLGCAAAGAWFLLGRIRTWRIVSRGQEAVPARALMEELGGRNIGVLESPAAPTALTAGVMWPVVVLPLDWRQWPADRLRAVLLHEWMHVARRDLMAQAVAQLACTLYWFHPLAWMAARQLRKERERACDDAVLARGVEAHNYAEHLVELVRALGRKRFGTMAMAEPSDLESRVRALLDSRRRRQPLSRRAALGIAAGCLAVLLPASAIDAYARPYVWWIEGNTEVAATAMDEPAPQATPAARGALTGVVLDPSAARVPNCQVTARNLDGANEETTRADSSGTYHFAAIPPGRYSVEVLAPGFRTMKVPATVAEGQSTVVNANLTIGSVSEAMTVQGAKPAAAAAAPATPAGTPQRIRVGGMVQAALLIARVPPIYPPDLKAQGITGTVMLRALITKQGYLSHLEVVNTDVDPGLAAAAKDAVSHWLYQPTLLNGEPVEVLTTIDVTFALTQ